VTSALVFTLLLAVPGLPSKIQWEKSFDQAMEHAQAADKPLMVFFRADWCGWCHRLDRTTFQDPMVEARAERFVAVRIDTEGSPREAEVVEDYEVHSVPTVLFLSRRGHQLVRVPFQGPGQFPHTMDRALEAARRVGAWEEALEGNPADPAALFALGQHMFEQECFQDSLDLLARAAANDRQRPAEERRRTRLLLAILQNVQRHYAQAEVVIKEALSIDPRAPDQPQLLFILGRTYVSWGRRADGVSTMETIVREHPQSPMAQKAREALVLLEQE
jgi:thiol-disulfide isomerase/thioredoxin